MNTARLDPQRLAEIAGLEAFRPGLCDRLIGLFEATAAPLLPNCAGEGDVSESQRRAAAHALKGAAMSIGAAHLGRMAQRIEQAGNRSAEPLPDGASLRAELAATLEELGAWRQGLREQVQRG